jgi:hypothetical protein
MSKLHLKYVQSFGGYHYFRRAGQTRVRLPGVVGSAEFMAAYQQALAAAPKPIGASKRSLPGPASHAHSPSTSARRASAVFAPRRR